VRRPFLVEGLLQGLIAGVVAAFLLAALYAGLAGTIDGLDRAGWPGGSPLPMLVGVVLLGGMLGLLASWVAVRTFVKRVRLS
jgi:cell division transport system permease protein